MRKIEWGSREEWAEGRRTVYADMDNPNPASKRLSDYATPDEIAAAIAALDRSYHAYGRQMADAKKACADLIAKFGTTKAEMEIAYWRLTEEERERWSTVNEPWWKRQQINNAKKLLRNDSIPRCLEEGSGLPEIADILARYEAAEAKADQVWRDRVAQTAIDDAAWERELADRRKIDEMGDIKR